ncbi:angio-associated migratory cell protein [Galleria mellonella]|uniref:Angio-associated migratory cell protein n=1 Tax=Galleria mellonella TaxID=7137 RepID=A0A6J1WPD7_GALME|nr:angio-associated migratory cell protein [Galleria mellonella]XP_026757132.2 angio-associated migratory cell protein [Galleria mellonella]
MREYQQDTPPSSVSGDEISAMDADGVIYLDEVDEIQLDEEMEDDEEDTEMKSPEDHAILVFDKHVGSVFCCDLHPDGNLAVSGGEDDKAYVWSVASGQIVMDCTGHKDSVVFVGFSFDGVYLATIDMSGLIKVWKCNLENNQQEPWKAVFEYESGDFTWGFWHFGAHVLICGIISGDIYVFKIPSGETKVLQGPNEKVECGKLFNDGVRLAAGYEDGSVKIWDLKTRRVLQQIPSNVHKMRVNEIDTHHENNLVASVSGDGKLVLFASNNGKIVGQLESDIDLEIVAFSKNPQLDYFATGTLTGSISIWDTSRQMVRHECTRSDETTIIGVTKMIWIQNHLVVGCLDGSVRVYEGRSGEQCLLLTGHKSEVLEFSYNVKQNIILTASDDGTARIFKYDVNKDND